MASGLKWMLFSNSVVFMAPPTKTSWAMEEKLVPYVHYIPLWQNKDYVFAASGVEGVAIEPNQQFLLWQISK